MTWRTTIIPVAKWTVSWTQNVLHECFSPWSWSKLNNHLESWLLLSKVTGYHGIRMQPTMGFGIQKSKSNLWQEPGGDETSAFDHICRDASPGYEGRGRTGTIKKTIFSLISREKHCLHLLHSLGHDFLVLYRRACLQVSSICHWTRDDLRQRSRPLCSELFHERAFGKSDKAWNRSKF